jgi:hypothetical protein
VPTRWGGVGLVLLSVCSFCSLCFWGLARRQGLESNEVNWCCTCVMPSAFGAHFLCFEVFVFFRLSVMLLLLEHVQSVNAICRLLQAYVI